jgi:thiosulfate reductase / polysulfide reductase chain A
MEEIIRSVCQACHCECGVLVQIKDGKVTKIKGDPAHPMNRGFTCVKGQAQPEILYHPERLLYPRKRAGKRGSGKWERISWDQALDEIAKKLTAIKEKYGPTSFGTMHGTGPRPSLYSTVFLAYALGSPNVISVDNHICNLPSRVAERFTLGSSVTMEIGPDYLNSNCIVVVGGNPLTSHPPRGVEILEAKQKRKAKLIVIDPFRTELAAKADLWLQIRPGTDISLALGMMNTIINEELYDKDFVHKWCYGFEQLKERVQEYPIDKVAELTWIPADQIREAARLYATTKPAVMHHRVAIEHNINSTQTCRALAILIALTGNIDLPGGNLLPMSLPGYVSHPGRMFPLDREMAKKRIGAKEHPMSSGPEAFTPVVLAPVAREAIHLSHPYPVKALFCAGGNPVVNMQDVKRVWEILKNDLELHVVADFLMTMTAELADYVLPAATWLERDDTCNIMYTNYVAAKQKVVNPIGECWHDVKIAIEWVKRIPWADRRFLPWNDTEEYNEALVKGTGMTFQKFKQKGCVIIPMKYKKYEEKGFDTPTEKVELYSTAFEKNGYDPLPFYLEPPESPFSTPDLFKQYPFILYTGNKQTCGIFSFGRAADPGPAQAGSRPVD